MDANPQNMTSAEELMEGKVSLGIRCLVGRGLHATRSVA